MKWLNKLERKFGRFAIKDLMIYIVFLNAAVFLIEILNPNIQLTWRLTFIPQRVLQGEIWRIITFIFIPPTNSLIWIIFALYFYYMVGTNLEHQWGSFKFNIYYLIGMVATILAAFLTGRGATGVYLNLSLFLAFAHLFPNHQILLFLMIPVKVKYLALFNWIIIGFTVIFSPVPDKAAALASVVNYLIFFNVDIIREFKHRRQVYNNRKRFKDAYKK